MVTYFCNVQLILQILSSHTAGYEEFCILEYNIVQSVESRFKFPRNVSLPSAVSKNKPNKPAGSR